MKGLKRFLVLLIVSLFVVGMPVFLNGCNQSESGESVFSVSEDTFSESESESPSESDREEDVVSENGESSGQGGLKNGGIYQGH